MRQPKYSKGQRVRIVANNVQPEYVGSIGRVSQVRYLDVEEPVYKVRVKGVTLRLWATEDCLEAADSNKCSVCGKYHIGHRKKPIKRYVVYEEI